ncbi:MAG: MBL fold metallo-hydrolase [Acidobacteria bacterium RIFCSPLOWO2_02_FULL_65_29]|nr:MAG: MBL fold metallo-hydrolase [Acidobacteria bacterium RIFCSPLOWO2_02_FULL_65_29]
MRTLTALAVGAVMTLASAACGPQAGTLEAAADVLGANTLTSIEYSGTGRWFQFGQAPSPTLPWPQFDVSSFTAAVNYAAPSARVQMTRMQTVEPGRLRPAPVEQRPVQLVSGAYAWNLAAPAGAQPGAAPAPQPQPVAVEERTMEIWATPQGFLKAALANSATSQPSNEGSDVSFTVGGKNRYVGTINLQNQVARVQTWIDNPILGDTLVQTDFSDYRDFGGVMFPAHIVRTQGGHPVLDLTVSGVTANPAVDIPVPDAVRNFTPPAVRVDAQKLANGVYYMTGGSHHSVAVDQTDHIVVVEGPQNEERSLAVIAKVKETIPNKPIRYLINSHVHFDHSGGLRSYVDEGATIVTHQSNQAYYEKAWAAPRTLNPDRLAKSTKAATFQTFTDKHVLTDGKRSIEIHLIAGSGHNDGFAMVYFPAEKILVEVDAWAPVAANAAPPAVPSPFAVNLHENILKLKLDVRRIAALHGPGLATIADFRNAIGVKATD